MLINSKNTVVLFRKAANTFVFPLLFLPLIANTQTPTIVPIPTLGGSATTPYDVNALGQVVGSSYLAGDAQEHAFLFVDGTMYDLGTLGGNLSVASSINNLGAIVGYSSPSDNPAGNTAFLYSGNTMLSLGTLGGSYSFARAINNAGQVIGDSRILNDAASHAFLYSNGRMADPGTLGGSYAAALAINSVGWVVGESSLTGEAQTHAFLWNGNTLLDLGTLGGSQSSANAINDSGWVTGYSYTTQNLEQHAFLYDGNSMRDLGTLGATFSIAYAIDKAGQVAGDSYTADWANHGFIYSQGRMQDLGTLGGSYSSVYDMNSEGLIIGQASDATETPRPFLWEKGTMLDLNTLIPSDSGWQLDAAYNISDGGHIIGYGTFHGQITWYLLSLNRPTNQPPIADAGVDQVVECRADNRVELDGSQSSDPDGDVLQYEWSSQGTVLGTSPQLAISVPLGTYTLTLKVTDPSGASAQDTVAVQVVDTTAPTVICPVAPVVSAGLNCQATIPDLLANLQTVDACTSANALTKTQNPPAGTVVGLGQYPVEITVCDAAGNIGTCQTLVTVADKTPPAIHCVSADPYILSPANHKMVPVTISVVASDNCDAAPVSRIVSVSVNESSYGYGPNWEITGPLTLYLKAEDSKNFTKRIYTILVETTDISGNKTTGSVTVQVTK